MIPRFPTFIFLVMALIIAAILLNSCTKYEWDGFDPTTATLKYILKKEKKDGTTRRVGTTGSPN
tara:strand:+ start:1167 stop:1358 length:192 start_codon:yes stop_codon:yes gene_type:complete